MTPRIATHGPYRVAGLAKRHSTPTLIPEQWSKFSSQIAEMPGKIGRSSYGIVWNASRSGFEYLSGVEVAAAADLVAGMQSMKLPNLRYAVFDHIGHVSDLPATMAQINTEWPSFGLKRADFPAFMEHYGERFDRQAREGVVEIWVPIADD